jgi:hypothetical protein
VAVAQLDSGAFHLSQIVFDGSLILNYGLFLVVKDFLATACSTNASL